MTLPLRGPTSDADYRGPRLLRRALVVVQFSPVLKIADKSGAGIAEFQDSVRLAYPLVDLELEQQLQLEMRAEGGVQAIQKEQPVWRLSDVEKAWRVSLTTQTLALETSGETYTHWADFAERIQELIREVDRHFDPAQKIRIGVRYVNAAPAAGPDDPRKWCAPALVSVSGDPELIQSDLLWRFAVDEGLLILRSGVLLPNTTYEPGVFDPAPERTWYLDIDIINEAAAPFDGDAISEALMRQVRRVHEIYKWAIPNPIADEVRA